MKLHKKIHDIPIRLWIVVLCFLLLLSNQQKTSKSSYEDTKGTIFQTVLYDQVEDGINQLVNEVFPLKKAWEDGISYKEQWLTELTKSCFPIFQFQWGYEAKETLAVDNQEYLSLLGENEDENKEEMQKEEFQQEIKEEKPIKQEVVKEKKLTYKKSNLYEWEYLLNNFYVVESTAKLLPSELNGKRLLSKDLTINTKGKKPKILIYHTHGSESFSDSREGKKSDTVIGVGDKLTALLEEEYGISVYHDRTVYDVIDGKLDRSRAYNYALVGINQILRENPSIEVILDVHRDGVPESTHLVTTINGKKTAKIMFMNGISRSSQNGDIQYLYNPNKEGNLAFALQLQIDGNQRYPTLMRKIYIKSYRYNLHLKPRSLLIEVGANTNSVSEVKNAMIPLASMLSKILKGK